MKLLGVGIYLLAALSVAAWAVLKPHYEWDVLGYMASALSFEETDKKSIHTQVYALAHAAMPLQAYTELVSQTPYRRDMYADYDHFAQQIPFYSIRPLYVGAIYLLNKAGVNLARAPGVVSALAYFAIAVVLLLWINNYIAGVNGIGLPLLLILSPPMLMIAREMTPDALSAAVLIAAVYLLAEKRALTGFALLTLASVWIKTDNVIYALILFSYLLVFGKDRLALSFANFALLVAGAVASCLAIDLAAGNYGWSTVFHHTFVQFITNPAEQRFPVSFSVYLAALRSGLSMAVSGSMMIFLFFGLLAYYLSVQKKILLRGIYSHLMLILGLSVLIRYLLFPAMLDRFFIAHYMLTAVMLIIAAVPPLGGRNRERIHYITPAKTPLPAKAQALQAAGRSYKR